MKLKSCVKFHEEIISNDVTNNKSRIMSSRRDLISWRELKPILKGLQSAIIDCDQIRIRGFFIQDVFRFKSLCNIIDVFYKEKL